MALSPRDRRALIILAVILVVAGVALLLFRESIFGDGGAEQAAPTPTVSPSPTIPPEDEDGEAPRPPTISFFAGRDPFVPLVVAAPPGPATEPAPVGTPPPGAEEEEFEGVTVGGHRVVLVDVFRENGVEKVQVTVDGETFVAAEGESFAGNFKVVSIDGGCATFLFGDESFTLCEPGERK